MKNTKIAPTPAPWRIDGWDLWEEGNPDSGFTGITTHWGCQTKLSKANLKRIVRAVNNFEGLVGALEDCLSELETRIQNDLATPTEPRPELTDETCIKARAALQAAKEGGGE